MISFATVIGFVVGALIPLSLLTFCLLYHLTNL
jgi:hypothetical protein